MDVNMQETQWGFDHTEQRGKKNKKSREMLVQLPECGQKVISSADVWALVLDMGTYDQCWEETE